MQQQENVAIFWDFDCPLPSNVSGYAIVENIMSIAHTFGSVKQFKAYLNMSSSVALPTLRSQLQTSGVSLTDCPPHRGKDMTDKMLLVDAIAYAIDNPPPATIILITNEQDYSYAVSILRLRRYRVVVIAPRGTIIAQASVQLDWHSEVLRAPLEEPNPPNPPEPVSRTRADSTSYTPSTSRTQYMTDPDELGHDDIYETYGKYRRGSVSRAPRVNGTGDPVTSQRYSDPASGRQTPAGYPRAREGMSPPATFHSMKSSSPSPSHKAPEPVLVTEGNGLFECSTRTPNLPKGFPFSEPESHPELIQPSIPYTSPTESSPSSALLDMFQPPSIPVAAETAKTPPPTIPPIPKSATNTSAPAVKSAPLVTSQAPLTKPAIGTSAPSGSTAPKGAHAQPTTLGTTPAPSTSNKAPPSYFVLLAQRLQARREALGHPRIPRSDIGNDLARYKSIDLYGQAGVTNFAAFINLAQAAGVVKVGGANSDQWVSLRPEWRGTAATS